MGNRIPWRFLPTTTQVKPPAPLSFTKMVPCANPGFGPFELEGFCHGSGVSFIENRILLEVSTCPLSLSLLSPLQGTVQRKIRTNAAVQTAAVFAHIWAQCVNVTQVLGWTTPAPAA